MLTRNVTIVNKLGLHARPDGPGEAAAMESMVSLIESGFGEEE